MSDFNNNLAAVRRRFKPAEMMLLAGSAMGRKVDPVGFAEQVRRDVAASSGVFPMIIKKYRINAEYLVTKLQATSPELMEVLLARLGDWQQLDVDEMMAENGLPSVSTLSRLGLVEPAGVAAWGLVCLRHASAIYEFVLNRPERMRLAESRTADAVAADLIQLVEAAPSPLDDETVLDCVYRLVKVTGLRRCLVVADDRSVRVTEIPVKDLLQDLYQGSLKGVVLAGVNAPDSTKR